MTPSAEAPVDAPESPAAESPGDAPGLPAALAESSPDLTSVDQMAKIADDLFSKWLSDDAEITADKPATVASPIDAEAMTNSAASVVAAPSAESSTTDNATRSSEHAAQIPGTVDHDFAQRAGDAN